MSTSSNTLSIKISLKIFSFTSTKKLCSMKTTLLLLFSIFNFHFSIGQLMTPDLLWKLGRVSPEIISADGKNLIYGVSYYNMSDNKGERNLYSIPLDGGPEKQITKTVGSESNVIVAPNGKMGYLYKGQYWESNWDGTAAKQISKIDGGVSLWKFSSDGKYVLYAADTKVGTGW